MYLTSSRLLMNTLPPLLPTVNGAEVHRLGLGKDYVSYKVNTLRDDGSLYTVTRRFKDFRNLFKELTLAYPNHVLAKLPEKNLADHIFRFKPDFIQRRREGLQRFLEGLAIHPVIGESKQFVDFLTVRAPQLSDLRDAPQRIPDEYMEMEKESGYTEVATGHGHEEAHTENGVDGRFSILNVGTDKIHLSTIKTINAVAQSYHAQERFDEAKELYLQV